MKAFVFSSAFNSLPHKEAVLAQKQLPFLFFFFFFFFVKLHLQLCHVDKNEMDDFTVQGCFKWKFRSI